MVLRQKLGGLGKNERGFTLPEVMITIVLIGIVTAIASSSWFGLVESRRVTAATKQLTADMRLAHTRATNQLASWRIVLVPGREAASAGPDYYLVKMNSGGATIDSSATIQRTLPDDTRIVADPLLNDSGLATLYAALSLGTAPTRSLEFDSDGSMDILAPAAAPGRDTVDVTQDGSPYGRITFNEQTSRINDRVVN